MFFHIFRLIFISFHSQCRIWLNWDFSITLAPHGPLAYCIIIALAKSYHIADFTIARTTYQIWFGIDLHWAIKLGHIKFRSNNKTKKKIMGKTQHGNQVMNRKGNSLHSSAHSSMLVMAARMRATSLLQSASSVSFLVVGWSAANEKNWCAKLLSIGFEYPVSKSVPVLKSLVAPHTVTSSRSPTAAGSASLWDCAIILASVLSIIHARIDDTIN